MRQELRAEESAVRERILDGRLAALVLHVVEPRTVTRQEFTQGALHGRDLCGIAVDAYVARLHQHRLAARDFEDRAQLRGVVLESARDLDVVVAMRLE